MKKRCTPHLVEQTYQKARSWRKAAERLNQVYGVSLSHTTWRDYGIGKHDLADEETRARLLLGPRPCPTCGHKKIRRKKPRKKQIRKYGYPTERDMNFIRDLKSREPMR
jgi:hypothetical protein